MKRTTLVLIAVLTLCGCSTFRGAPRDPFPARDIWSKEQVRASVSALSGYCPEDANANASYHDCVHVDNHDDRNKSASLLLALVDIEYSDFSHKFVYDKQHLQASTNFLRLLMTVSGGLTTSTGVKDNYLAGASLLSGGDAIIDSEYLFKATTQALVASMDATRAKLRTDIDKKMRLPIQDYSGPAALADIRTYYRAGTIVQAVADAQKNAATQQAEEEEIQRANLDTQLKTRAVK